MRLQQATIKALVYRAKLAFQAYDECTTDIHSQESLYYKMIHDECLVITLEELIKSSVAIEQLQKHLDSFGDLSDAIEGYWSNGEVILILADLCLVNVYPEDKKSKFIVDGINYRVIQ